MTPTINIYRADGTVLMEAVVTKDAVARESLMTEDCIELRWSAAGYFVLPEGAYITDDAGERYRLLRPYYPSQKNELRCDYSPVFLSRVMCWEAVPLFFYTYAADGVTITSRETDWSLTATPATFMSYLARVIEVETGEHWTVTVSDDIKQTTASVTFQSTDLLSGLNAVSSAFGTEWRADKKNNTLHLGAAAHGSPVRLEVGGNVNVPSTTASRQEYGNRYYVLGASRNIAQAYEGANVNNMVTRRLTLDPAKYPGGYIDTRAELTKDEIVPRFLTFDNVYPRSALVAYDVRCRLVYRLDESGDKVQIGTNGDGSPVYDQYAVWYFKAKDKTTGKQYLFDVNDLIKGQNLSVSFLGGALTGRDFELTYYDRSKVVNTSDGTPLQIDKGDFEINFVEEGSYIIPAVTALVPADGDTLTLFNINMPAEYHASAYLELETAALEEIDRRNRDLNNYEVQSNPVVFYDNDPGLTVGQKVIFVNVDGREIETRVLSITRKLDRPYEQTITLGNEVVKGAISEIKDNVVNANTNLAVISQLQELNTAFTQAYTRAQQQLLESFARMSQIWKLDEDGNVYTERNVYSYKEIVAGGKSDGLGGAGGVGGALNLFDLLDVELTDRVNGDLLAWNGAKWTNIRQSDITPDLTGYATEAWVKAQGYLTEHQSLAGYATQSWVEGKGYALASDLDGYLPLIGGTLTGPLTMGGAGVHRIYFKDAEHFIELDEDGSFHFSHDVYTDGEIVAGGWQTPGEDDVPVVGALSDLTDVKLTGLASGHALVYNGSNWVNQAISGGLDESALASYLSSHDYITSAALSDYATTAQLENYVSKAGDTMTGNLVINPSNTNIGYNEGIRINEHATSKWASLYLGGAQNSVQGVSGNAWLIGVSPDKHLIIRSQPNDGIDTHLRITQSDMLWKGGKIWCETNDGAGSGLDADLLDGYHEGSFFRHNRGSVSADYYNGTTYQNLAPGAYAYNYGGAAGLLVSFGNTGASASSLEFYTTYPADTDLLFRKKIDGNRFAGAWTKILTPHNYAATLDTRYVKKSGDTMTGSLEMGTAHYLYGINETYGSMIHFDGTRTVIGSCGATSTKATHLRSKTGHLTVGTGVDATYNILDSGNYSSVLDARYVKKTGDTMTGNLIISASDTTERYARTANSIGTVDLLVAASGNRGVYNRTSSKWIIGSNGTNTFLLNGNVGVNTTSPLDKLHVYDGYIRVSYATDDRCVRITPSAFRFISRTSGAQADEVGFRKSDDSAYLGIIGGAYAPSANTLSYLYYGGTSYTSPAMVILPNLTIVMGATANSSGAKLHVVGNIYSSGDQVSASSSDRRLKQRFAIEDYTSRIMRLGAVIDYEWSGKARALDPDRYDAVRHSSVVWQRARKVGIPGFCGVDDRGYGFVNWLNKDYQASLLGAVQETIRAVHRHDDEIRRLRRRVSELEGIVNDKCA